MSIKLPPHIAAFVQAKTDHNSEAVIACYADNAHFLTNGGRITLLSSRLAGN
jgi:hypothetical protein